MQMLYNYLARLATKPNVFRKLNGRDLGLQWRYLKAVRSASQVWMNGIWQQVAPMEI